MNGNTSFELETSVEAELGNITIIRKDGMDGGNYPLLRGTEQWTLGRGEDADIKFKVRKNSYGFSSKLNSHHSNCPHPHHSAWQCTAKSNDKILLYRFKNLLI